MKNTQTYKDRRINIKVFGRDILWERHNTNIVIMVLMMNAQPSTYKPFHPSYEEVNSLYTLNDLCVYIVHIK